MTTTTLRARHAALIRADAALAANARREQAAGITSETPEYLRLNRAVDDALHALPWWARVVWGGDWHWFARHPKEW